MTTIQKLPDNPADLKEQRAKNIEHAAKWLLDIADMNNEADVRPVAVLQNAIEDLQRFDWIEAQGTGYGRGWIARMSTTGRGYRLMETSGNWEGREPMPSARLAVDDAMEGGDVTREKLDADIRESLNLSPAPSTTEQPETR